MPAHHLHARGRSHVRPFALIADALRRQADELSANVRHMEECAARIGLPPISASRAIFDLREQAQLLAEAHTIITRLTPVESTIRAIMEKAA